MAWQPWARRAGWVLLAALLIAGPPQVLPSFYVNLATRVLIFAVFAMSLDLLLGYTGLWSFGHAAFFGVAAYAVGLFTLRVQNSFVLAVLVGLGATVLVAAVFGLLVLRTRGVYFMMLTLALAQVLWGVAFKWRALTGGDDGLPAIPRPDLSPLPFKAVTSADFYVLTAVVFVVVTVLMFLITRSPFGHSLEGIRENEVRMSALGYNVWLHGYLVYILSAFFAGVAGMLFVYSNGIASPTDLSVVRSAEALLMVVLGGGGTLFGPIFGALVVVLLQNLVGLYTERWLTILGLVYVLTVLFAPRGIYDAVRRRLPLARLRRPARDTSPQWSK
jgi:branched-chain amino acid transport system permease protein